MEEASYMAALRTLCMPTFLTQRLLSSLQGSITSPEVYYLLLMAGAGEGTTKSPLYVITTPLDTSMKFMGNKVFTAVYVKQPS